MLWAMSDGTVTEVDREDAALLARLRAGEATAYEQLVRTETGKLLAVARRILPTEEDARDAVQDAFLFAFRSLDRFQGNSRLSTWLHRIVVNASLMKLRTARRKREESLEPLLPTYKDDGHHAERFATWDDPTKTIERAENKALVRQLISQLPDAYRTVLLLRDIEGLDTEETARLLETTPNAVKVRLHRARQALRTLLAPHFKKENA
jgi:RNA polymerase sigma-70 factor, ECF subfamily